MSLFWAIVGVLVLIVWAITLVDIFRSHLGSGRTAAWVLIVVLLPFIGSLAYWVMRPTTAEDLDRRAAAEEERRRGRTPPGAPMGM